MSGFFIVKEHTVPAQYIREFPDATFDDQECELFIHVKQYVPKHSLSVSARPVTILGAHANGFSKELYEVLWEYLCQNLDAKGIEVRGIWIADVAHQGVSGHLNAGRLGNSPHWDDSARDLLSVVNHFRKEMPRPIVGVGHSLGGGVLTSLSLMHPRLLAAGLVLIDPVILSKHSAQLTNSNMKANPVLSLVRLSAMRRDQWASREEATKAFQKSKFYQSWDPRVLNLWLEHGLRSTASPGTSASNNPVTLSTPKDQEVFTFLLPKFDRLPALANEGPVHASERIHHDPEIVDDFPFYRPEPPALFEKLKHLRPSTLFVFADQSALSEPNSCKERVERTGTGVGGSGGAIKAKVKAVTMENAGHLVPFEKPEETADVIGRFLVDSLTNWRKEDDEWAAWWRAKSLDERTKVSDRWKNELGIVPRPAEGGKGKL